MPFVLNRKDSKIATCDIVIGMGCLDYLYLDIYSKGGTISGRVLGVFSTRSTGDKGLGCKIDRVSARFSSFAAGAGQVLLFSISSRMDE